MKFEHCPNIQPTVVNCTLLLLAGGGQSRKHFLQTDNPFSANNLHNLNTVSFYIFKGNKFHSSL
jgi:hypothetical protein